MFRSVLNRVKNLTTIAFSDKYLLATNVGISISLSGVGDMIEVGNSDLINGLDMIINCI